jgi:cytoskeletal protein CcmA (bactofilin family)
MSTRQRRAALAGAAGLMLAALATLATLVAPPVRAQDEDEDRIVIAKGTVHDGNLYAFAQDVVVDGTVTGDVVGAGQIVQVGESGRVEGDLLGAGYAVLVDGEVAGDVRAAGYMIQLGPAARVGGDLAGAGYSLGVGEGATVGGDLLGTGYQLLADGRIRNNLRFAGAGLALNGPVDGDVWADVAASGEPADQPFMFSFGNRALPQPDRIARTGLTVGEAARVGGDLTYESPTEAVLPEGLAEGTVTFERAAADDGPSAAERAERATPWWQRALLTFLGLAIAGLLAVWLAPRLMRPASAALRVRPIASLGYGLGAVFADLIGLIALVIAFALALAAVLGLQLAGTLGMPLVAGFVVLAVLMTFGLIVALFLGTLVTGNSIGNALLRTDATARDSRRVIGLLLGLAIVALLVSLPYGFGALVGFVIAVLGLGGLTLAWLRRGPAAGDAAAAEPPPAALAVPLPGQ